MHFIFFHHKSTIPLHITLPGDPARAEESIMGDGILSNDVFQNVR